MATRAELLSRGQASRNRHWAGVNARAQVAAILFLLCAGVGAFAGWTTAPDLTRREAALYAKTQGRELLDPFGRNLHTYEAETRVAARDDILDPASPATRGFKRLLWRMGFFAILCGVAIGVPLYRWRRRAWASAGEKAGRDRTVRGAERVDAATLARMVPIGAAERPVTIGGVPVPVAEEARHFLFAGATGTGKTTAIWAMLDQVERRGQHAFVHDVDGGYVARYYRPERGDLILNPFDARCAYWNPFSDVRSASDADRLAGFIVAKPAGGSAGGDDVWYDQARIVVAAVIRRLWEQGRGNVPELTRALRDMTPDELAELTRGTEAARVFQKDADKATASVLFCLAEAAKIVGALKAASGDGPTVSFDDFYAGLPGIEGAKPWIFLASRKRNFAAARPLLGCWLDCAVAAILDRPIKGAPRAWLVLDELPALPRASGLLTLLPEGRKFGAACVIAFQAIGQLRDTYGPNAAGTIVGQAGTQLVMRLGDPESTKWATELLGRSEVEEHRSSASLDSDAWTDKGSLSTMRQTKPIVLDSEIGHLPPLTGFLRLSGLPIARVAIDRAHMERPDIAEATVPVTARPAPGATSVSTITIDRTAGGAL
ncbi:type IV secretion system DNA-binding domain-containing protein [Sphingomonas bacterium]|uniref:type IV secretion system DNA-binding domain-containing protein n=1 Tax=Sphingomonas bacterium TaxID=1895847 RepID=UPI0015762F50|nr:type IV secretion system DNA-binding domain-containing protein [Sphingomonas bacterium]